MVCLVDGLERVSSPSTTSKGGPASSRQPGLDCSETVSGWLHERTSDPPSGPSTSSIGGLRLCGLLNDSYLVDPASSHMLVSKIKPCMYKYKPQDGETANGSLNQLWFLRSYNATWTTVAILELIHATELRPSGKSAFIRPKPIVPQGDVSLVTLNNFVRIARPPEPATYLSNVCPINCRWYATCLPWL